MISFSCFWPGKDHLLCVDTSGYTETYQRFYFRDIQTVILMASNRRGMLELGVGPSDSHFPGAGARFPPIYRFPSFKFKPQ